MTQSPTDETVEAVAREALFKTEMARTDVVNPVNGSAAYSFVMFHGQRVPFHDGEWTTMHERDAGSAKAAAYAQKINDALFDLAKTAARAALASIPASPPSPAGDVEPIAWMYHHPGDLEHGWQRYSFERRIQSYEGMSCNEEDAGVIETPLYALAALQPSPSPASRPEAADRLARVGKAEFGDERMFTVQDAEAICAYIATLEGRPASNGAMPAAGMGEVERLRAGLDEIIEWQERLMPPFCGPNSLNRRTLALLKGVRAFLTPKPARDEGGEA